MKRKIFKIQDLTQTEYDLLYKSFWLHKDKDEPFVCFGRYYDKLRQLELVDNENQITYTGRQLVKFLMARLDP